MDSVPAKEVGQLQQQQVTGKKAKITFQLLQSFSFSFFIIII